ncbi:MAG: ATP-binding cassette domain-containing protein [Eubacteriales bacterium]|nr:ATP-binding cassette domain-containing protein [Eubacteriales bacterium]
MEATTKEREVLLEVKDLDVTFRNGRKCVEAVKKANFKIFKGETFALVGESGSGKTTIGRAIIRLNQTAGGEILFKGKRINCKLSKSEAHDLVREMQMIFQDPAASLNERATIDYCVGEGLDNFHLYADREERRQKIDTVLDAVGLLPEHKTRYPHEFSGGQRQRIGIARAIVMEPDLIIADEPISALDVSIRAQVLNLLNKFQKERGLTYLFIAHDLSVVRYFSDRIAVIHKGVIVEVAETEELFAYPLHPYTRSLLQSVPIPDPRIEKAKTVISYRPTEPDPSEEYHLREIVDGHFVYCSSKEVESFRQRHEKGAKEREEVLAQIKARFAESQN